MEEEGALIFAHISMVVAVIMPALIMKMVDTDKPNMLMGYRTPWSMKSDLTWKYANSKSADYLIWNGLLTVSVQVIAYIFFGSVTAILAAAIAMTVGIIAVMVVVEVNLRKKFNKDGSLKNEFDDLD